MAWARVGKAQTMRATYSRRLGTEVFLGFLDLHDDVLSGIFRARKGVREVGLALRRLRACYPKRTTLYVILDNLHMVHDHPRFLALARELGIRLVFTPPKRAGSTRSRRTSACSSASPSTAPTIAATSSAAGASTAI